MYFGIGTVLNHIMSHIISSGNLAITKTSFYQIMRAHCKIIIKFRVTGFEINKSGIKQSIL